jgi:hypothetical protein
MKCDIFVPYERGRGGEEGKTEEGREETKGRGKMKKECGKMVDKRGDIT